MLLHGVRGPRFLQGSEFAAWQGLDGTTVPLYMHQPIPREMTFRETLAREMVLGRLSAPPLMIDLPDMIAIDDAWIEERKALEFVTLEDALAGRLEENPVRPKVRLYTNWSYIEGIRAEQLSRSTIEAEREALRAEAFNALAWGLGLAEAASTDEIWKTILKSQHHDVYCFSAPELRDKAIGWLGEAGKQAGRLSSQAIDALLAQIQTDAVPGQPVVVFSSLAQAMEGLVEIVTALDNPMVYDEGGARVPCETRPSDEGGARVRFAAPTNGLGYSTYWLRGGTLSAKTQEIESSYHFENPYYRVVIQPDGAISSLQVLPSAVELVDNSRSAGNSLSATDSASISFHAEAVEERVDHYLQDPEYRGPRLVWQAVSPGLVTHSSLGATIEVTGRMGKRIQARLTICCYQHLPESTSPTSSSLIKPVSGRSSMTIRNFW